MFIMKYPNILTLGLNQEYHFVILLILGFKWTFLGCSDRWLPIDSIIGHIHQPVISTFQNKAWAIVQNTFWQSGFVDTYNDNDNSWQDPLMASFFFPFIHPSPYLVYTEGIGRVAKDSEYFIWLIVFPWMSWKIFCQCKPWRVFCHHLPRALMGRAIRYSCMSSLAQVHACGSETPFQKNICQQFFKYPPTVGQFLGSGTTDTPNSPVGQLSKGILKWSLFIFSYVCISMPAYSCGQWLISLE